MRGIGFIALSIGTFLWFLITLKYFSSGVAQYSEMGSRLNFASALLLLGLFVFGYFFGKMLCRCKMENHDLKDSHTLGSFDFSKVTDTDQAGVDDLKVIEGVGPKLEQLLNKHNINSFVDLANKDTGDLQKIIESAGNKFAMHNPKTWPEQAKLASQGKWDELEKYQNFLYRGLDS